MQVNVDVGLTAILAVWGAFTGTFVLLWDIYKWRRSGPRISFRVSPNMKVYGLEAYPENKTYISAKAINKGDRPTTITNLGFRYYNNWFDKLSKKPGWQAVIGNPGLKPLPHILEPGTVWTGLADQDELEKKISKNGILIVELDLSHSKRPKKAKVVLPRENAKKD